MKCEVSVDIPSITTVFCLEPRISSNN